MRKFLLLASFLFFLSDSAFPQEYSYTHYDISDGLAGSTVYCITQDREGFIWTGTETGVSRFDGTHFRNFTTRDGLPDVEILEMFGDSQGRVWMAPFRKSICYYYKGKIYNQENDSLLRHIRFRTNIEHFAEDKDGNILVQEQTALQLIRPNGIVTEIDSINGRPILNCVAVSRSNTGQFIVQADQQIFNLSEKGFSLLFNITFENSHAGFISINPFGMIWRTTPSTASIRSFVTGKLVNFPFEKTHYRHISFSTVDDSLFYSNEFSGAAEYNLHTGRTKRFLPGKEVSRTFRDVTGNLWFTTLGQGLYRLNSDEFKTIRMKEPGMEFSSVSGIFKMDDQLVVGDNHNTVFYFSLPDMSLKKRAWRTAISKNRIWYVGHLSKGRLFIASDLGMDECTNNYETLRYAHVGVKSIFVKSSEELLLGTFWGVGRFDLKSFRMIDTLWNDRATTVYYRKDTSFIGTLNGLYASAGKNPPVYLGEKIPFLQKRISAIAESSDGTLWVASYDAGLIGYKDGRVIATISHLQGLTSDICRTILVHDNSLWIGTDKGLNRVRLDQPGYPVAQYTSKDGLGSDIVNALFADSSSIYVGTPAGLSYFDEAKVDLSEGCRLYLLSLFNSGRERIGDTGHLQLPYADKHIRLEFAGISYRSVGGITYRYRLLGLDSAWRTTKEAFLEYLTLPSGNYAFQLQATNKFGVSSALLTLPFGVNTPFWQTTWFYGLILAAFLSLTWLFVSLRIAHIRKREKEKEQLSQKMMEMEYAALQAQMNPHFIFNCLNSIQQYIFDQDIFAANKYISGFAKLIRATLQNSSKP
ncbi:MAG TPA: two-component regulator propeller domain-containing protein, partial [Puia sp.]|nr:two-component regulator propeller domain-containing protein [Puia sp.]